MIVLIFGAMIDVARYEHDKPVVHDADIAGLA